MLGVSFPKMILAFVGGEWVVGVLLWGGGGGGGGGRRLSLIQMILLRHLKAGFEKKGGDCRFDCDDYRPDTLGG